METVGEVWCKSTKPTDFFLKPGRQMRSGGIKKAAP